MAEHIQEARHAHDSGSEGGGAGTTYPESRLGDRELQLYDSRLLHQREGGTAGNRDDGQLSQFLLEQLEGPVLVEIANQGHGCGAETGRQRSDSENIVQLRRQAIFWTLNRSDRRRSIQGPRRRQDRASRLQSLLQVAGFEPEVE